MAPFMSSKTPILSAPKCFVLSSESMLFFCIPGVRKRAGERARGTTPATSLAAGPVLAAGTVIVHERFVATEALMVRTVVELTAGSVWTTMRLTGKSSGRRTVEAATMRLVR